MYLSPLVVRKKMERGGEMMKEGGKWHSYFGAPAQETAHLENMSPARLNLSRICEKQRSEGERKKRRPFRVSKTWTVRKEEKKQGIV